MGVCRRSARPPHKNWSYLCGNEACCPAAGVPFDASAHPASAAMVGAGSQVLAGLTAVGAMIASYRGGGRFTSDYEIARITVALRDLRVRDDAWARMDPAHADAHQRLWTEVVRRAQPGRVAAPAALLALANNRQGQVTARAVIRTICPPVDSAATRTDAESGPTEVGRRAPAELSGVAAARNVKSERAVRFVLGGTGPRSAWLSGVPGAA